MDVSNISALLSAHAGRIAGAVFLLRTRTCSEVSSRARPPLPAPLVGSQESLLYESELKLVVLASRTFLPLIECAANKASMFHHISPSSRSMFSYCMPEIPPRRKSNVDPYSAAVAKG